MPNACDYNCTDLPAHEQIVCGAWKKGGISAVAYIDCTHTVTDWTNATQWQTNIDAGLIVIATPVKASIPEGAAVEGENPNGCGSATIVDTYDRTAEIKDFNVTSGNIDFYNSLNDRSMYMALYHGCDGEEEITVVESPVTFNARNVTPENNREKRVFMVTAKWTEKDMPQLYTAPTGIFV